MPPLPSLDGRVATWWTDSFDPSGYPEGDAISVNSDGTPQIIPFTASAPYPIDWDALVAGGDPPYLLDEWFDQNS